MRKLFAVLLTEIRLLFPENRERLKTVVASFIQAWEAYPRERKFVAMVGYSKSGKNYWLEHDPVRVRFFQLSSDQIHVRLNTAFPWLNDDRTITGPAYWPRQWLTQKVRQAVLEAAFKHGLNVVNDSCNLVRSERSTRLQLAKRYGYQTEIVWIQCQEATLVERLQLADNALRRSGKLAVWEDLYRRVQQPRFEEPGPEEADSLLVRFSE